MGNDRNRLQKLFEISIAKFDHFLFNYTVIEIDLEIDRNISADKSHYSVKNCIFLKFFGGIRGFLILTWDLEKKRRKVVVHHTPTGGSTVVVAVSVPLPYELWTPSLCS